MFIQYCICDSWELCVHLCLTLQTLNEHSVLSQCGKTAEISNQVGVGTDPYYLPSLKQRYSSDTIHIYWMAWGIDSGKQGRWKETLTPLSAKHSCVSESYWQTAESQTEVSLLLLVPELVNCNGQSIVKEPYKKKILDSQQSTYMHISCCRCCSCSILKMWGPMRKCRKKGKIFFLRTFLFFPEEKLKIWGCTEKNSFPWNSFCFGMSSKDKIYSVKVLM